MIRKGDIFRYTSTIGGDTDYYIGEVGEVILIQWCDNGICYHTERPINEIKTVLLSGHIRIVGREDKLPITFLRPHTFNPQLRRDIPISKDVKPSPYYTPKLYTWE
jgi:hypothetical protein